MNPNGLRSSTLRFARDLAALHCQHLCALFDDSLAGDVARLEVRRKLRRTFPWAEGEIIEALIQELLTP